MTGSALVTANQPHCSPCSILALAALALAPARLTQATPLSALCKQTPAPGSLHCSLHAVNQTRTDRQTSGQIARSYKPAAGAQKFIAPDERTMG